MTWWEWSLNIVLHRWTSFLYSRSPSKWNPTTQWRHEYLQQSQDSWKESFVCTMLTDSDLVQKSVQCRRNPVHWTSFWCCRWCQMNGTSSSSPDTDCNLVTNYHNRLEPCSTLAPDERQTTGRLASWTLVMKIIQFLWLNATLHRTWYLIKLVWWQDTSILAPEQHIINSW